MGWVIKLIIIGLQISIIAPSQAANTPCSGSKGGISHCRGDIFICNDGSVSGSKKSCQAAMGAVGDAAGLINPAQSIMQSSSTSECSCRDGLICTGPRGGKYCIDDRGKKSYLRR